MPVSYASFAIAVELTLAAGGLVLLWRVVFSAAARAAPRPAGLPAWEVSVADFLTFLVLVMAGSFIAAATAGLVGKALALKGSAASVLNGSAAQLGMLAGVVLHRRRLVGSALAPRKSWRGVIVAGATTFLVAIPLLLATAHAWEYVLKLLGLPAERQDLIGMFAEVDSPALLAIMIALAVIIAPLTEELVFRAGVFRYLRTRMPRAVALLLPAVVFALLHVNWHTLQGLASVAPLVVLAVVFSVAYERTGRIETAIVAHACFNLNTLFIIFSGVSL
ncbi:MAG: CPBP family intramembrane metalloprotease [Burkholderiales bacterium]|nr:CPBP family intramembrane metalloprotease [Burkholderiales bacterium]